MLAAGYSSRMHAFKPLLPLGGKTVLEVVVDTALEAGATEAVVVTGYQRELIEERIAEAYGDRSPVRTAFNPEFDGGMFTSIKAGIAALDNREGERPAGCFIMPVDCPLCGAATLKTMLKNMKEKKDDFAVPTFRGKKGHPLFVPQAHWREILDYEGPGGLKGITDRYFEQMKRIPVDSEGVVLDMDDRQAYSEILSFAKRGPGPSLRELAAGRRIILVRHGKIKQHKEKIFLGRTDVPLGEEGCAQALAAGKKLAELEPETHVLYSSPLLRARQTAELMLDFAGLPLEIREREGLQEMSLGDWDGMYIREIREKYPVQYEMRGRNLFTFKVGNHSENFYDMQYRAVRALQGILREDESRDIIVVSHKGVLRALENNLCGMGVQDNWQTIKNCEIRVIIP